MPYKDAKDRQAQRKRWLVSEAGVAYTKAYQQAYYHKNKAVHDERRKKWEAVHKDRVAVRKAAHRVANRNAYRDRALRKKYGITLEDYKTMEAAQSWACAICRQIKKLHVDHDHKTMKIRGLLCAKCNKALGLLQDRPELCYASGDYLKCSG